MTVAVALPRTGHGEFGCEYAEHLGIDRLSRTMVADLEDIDRSHIGCVPRRFRRLAITRKQHVKRPALHLVRHVEHKGCLVAIAINRPLRPYDSAIEATDYEPVAITDLNSIRKIKRANLGGHARKGSIGNDEPIYGYGPEQLVQTAIMIAVPMGDHNCVKVQDAIYVAAP